MHNERYPNHPRKSRMAFCHIKNRLLQMVMSDPEDIDRQRLLNEEKSAVVIVYMTVNPCASSRLITMKSGISQNICYKNST